MDEGERKQQAVFRSMTPEQKLRAATALYYSTRQLKEASLRAFHRDWSEEQIRKNVREWFLYGKS